VAAIVAFFCWGRGPLVGGSDSATVLDQRGSSDRCPNTQSNLQIQPPVGATTPPARPLGQARPVWRVLSPIVGVDAVTAQAAHARDPTS
jgi:hypothetical protein